MAPGRATGRAARVTTASSCRRMPEAKPSAETILVAAGRRPNVDGSWPRSCSASPTRLEASPLTTECGRTSRTSTRPATSWGPSNSRMWQGGRRSRRLGTRLLPGSSSGRVNPMAWVTFTDPEVAQVGLQRDGTRAQRFGDDDDRHASGTSLASIAPSVMTTRTDSSSSCRIRRGVLIGATIVASRAGEMSGELSLAIAKGLERWRCGDRRPRLSRRTPPRSSRWPARRRPRDGRQALSGRIIARLLGFAAGSLIRRDRTTYAQD